MKHISKAVESGLEEIFTQLELPEDTRGLLRDAFLRKFEESIKAGLIQQATDEQEEYYPDLQGGVVIAQPGNTLHVWGIGDLHIQRLIWQNWVRILFRQPVKDLDLTLSVKKIEFEEKTLQ